MSSAVLKLSSSLSLVLLFVTSSVAAEDSERKLKLEQESRLKEACSGTLYRSKKDEVPVYGEPDQTAQVVHRLSLGEKVCYIGEKGTFAILDWGSFLSVSGEKVQEERLSYVRLVDLWPPKNGSSRKESLPGLAGFFSKARSVFQRMGYGHPPEDALEPYDPIIGPLRNRQGKDCSTSQGCQSLPERELPEPE